MTQDFELRIEPDPALVATARLFAASVARQHGVPEGSVDDLKLAVTESCAASFDSSPDHHLTLTLRQPDEGPGAGVSVRVSSKGLRDVERAESTDPTRPVSGFAMVQALFDDARVLPGPEESSISFSLPAG